jgi:hypothetical protein
MYCQPTAAMGDDFSRNPIGFGLAGGEVDDDGISAMACQLGNGCADPATGAGDDQGAWLRRIMQGQSPWERLAISNWQLAFSQQFSAGLVVHVVASC